MLTVAYLRDRASRFRDLASRAGNFEDPRYLLELAAAAGADLILAGRTNARLAG